MGVDRTRTVSDSRDGDSSDKVAIVQMEKEAIVFARVFTNDLLMPVLFFFFSLAYRAFIVSIE